MESTEALSRHLENLGDLQQIVRTMKALSAASIRQYERAAETLAEYDRSVRLGLRAALREPGAPAPGPDLDAGATGVVLLGTDHGLCGRFNEVIAGHARELLQRRAGHDGPSVRRWLLVGERGLGALMGALAGTSWAPDPGAILELPVPGSAATIADTVSRAVTELDRWQSLGVTRVLLFHNRPTERGGYEPQGRRLLPADLDSQRSAQWRWPSRALPELGIGAASETRRRDLLAALLRQRTFVSLFRACAESQAAEHGSRLAAMQAAEKNLDERIEEVTGRYRRVRQAQITSELLDIVAGFEAVD